MLNQILLVVAPKVVGDLLETGEATALPQNKLHFSISPYLAPKENLLDLSPGSLKNNIKRLPPPIMYSIEPLPQKIKIEAIQSDAKDQALLGDPYDIKLKLGILEDIKLRSLKAIFKNFSTSASSADEQSFVSGAEHDSNTTQEGMVDIDLSTVSVRTGVPLMGQSVGGPDSS